MARSPPRLRPDLRLPLCDRLQGRGRADRDARVCVSRLRGRARIEASSSAARATRAGRWPNFAARRPALNAHDSNTGMNLFRAAIAPIAGGAPFFRAVVVTGSHEASVAAVAEGRADLAAIDCVSFALLGTRPPRARRARRRRRREPALARPAVHRQRPALARRRSPRCARRCSRRSPTRTSPKRARRSVSRARARRVRPTMIAWPRSSAARRRPDTPARMSRFAGA